MASCLSYFENPLIVELVSGSFGDDKQSLRIFKTFLAGETPRDPKKKPLPFEERCPFMDWNRDLPLAALNGRMSVVKWLYLELDREWRDLGLKFVHDIGTITCEKAAEGGHLDILKWINEVNYPPMSESAFTAAARNGHLDCLRWAWENKWCNNKSHVMYAAAEGGHLDILIWVRDIHMGWCERMGEAAARNGHLECLKWARANGCILSVETCDYATENGHLECLKWARENGCPWDAYTCASAAKNGHLECLKWARENGCPWDENTCRFAAANGHQDCLQWARENGCPES
jgi:hypothetical protein